MHEKRKKKKRLPYELNVKITQSDRIMYKNNHKRERDNNKITKMSRKNNTKKKTR